MSFHILFPRTYLWLRLSLIGVLSNFPYDAVEEALSNAVHHKDYQIPEPITVTVTPHKMEILSLSGPDRSISDESIKALKMVATRYRNRRIGDFLKELQLVEGRNTGVPNMLFSLEGNGSPLPLFETDVDRSYFRVTIYIHKAFLENDIVAVAKPVKRRKKSDVKEAVIEALSIQPRSSNELAKEVGYSTHRSGAFFRVIAELIEEGKIAYTNPDCLSDTNQKLYRVR
jgi:ATP-dependent DNA helicase RecG